LTIQKADINNKQELLFNFLAERQRSNGEFQSTIFFPALPLNGWIYAGPSPFTTSCILMALGDIDNDITKQIKTNGCKFIISLMERNGLWRFYPHGGIFKFNTPCDLDDTVLASYVLKKNGYSYPANEKLIYYQQKKDGLFYTWDFPRLKMLFQNPYHFFWLTKDLKDTYKILFPLKGRTEHPLISFSDSEYTVNANVLFFLGQNERTLQCINIITESILFGHEEELKQHFYFSKTFLYYHISRCYAAGIETFGRLSQHIENYFAGKIDNAGCVVNVLESATALTTLINLNINNSLTDRIAGYLSNLPIDAITQPYAYYTVKDRNMIGGSSELTAALYLEAMSKLR